MLIGICDASSMTYTAVVYMGIEGNDCIKIRFLCVKTMVTPIGGTTIPRLELLSALLLAKLINEVQKMKFNVTRSIIKQPSVLL